MLKLLWLLLLVFPQPGWTASEIHLTGMCRIYNDHGTIKAVFPGRQCLFMDDGRLISLGNSGLKAFSSEGKIEWEHPVSTPEAFMSFSLDKNRFYLTTATVISLFNTKGEVIHKLDLPEFPKAISEIPQLKKKSKLRWLKAGNILVSVPVKGIFVYSPDLKDHLHTIVINTARDQKLNDFFVTREGTLVSLIEISTETPPEAPGSALEEMTLETGKLLSRFPTVPNGSFYFPVAGSVEILRDGNFLLTHSFTGVYHISRDGKKILQFNTNFHFDSSGMLPPEALRTTKLDSFLKNWKL